MIGAAYKEETDNPFVASDLTSTIVGFIALGRLFVCFCLVVKSFGFLFRNLVIFSYCLQLLLLDSALITKSTHVVDQYCFT